MITHRSLTVPAPDEGSFEGHCAVPDAGRGPGILLIQEIFGVNDYIRAVADRLALLGYVVLAPNVFWRIRPGVALDGDTEDGLADGLALGQQLDVPAAVRDLAAALDHLRGLDEVDGPVGAVGFCLGGTLAYLLAAAADPDAVVSYYGSGVPGALDRLDDIDAPLLCHFGGADPYIARDDVDRVAAAAQDRPGVDVRVHEGAGHAFDNHESTRFSMPRPAVAAWGVTAVFLDRELNAGR